MNHLLLACVLGLLAAPSLAADAGRAAAAPAVALASPSPASLAARLEAATAAADALRGNADPQAYARAAVQVDALAGEAPEHPRVLALHAWLLMSAHRFAEALSAAERALALAPRERVALALRADALTELGRYAEAVAAVEALDRSGAGVPALLRAAHLRRLHGDPAGALELARDALARAPAGSRDRPWLVRELAALSWHAGDERAALALLAGLPESPETLMLQARILESAGDTAGAGARWQAAAEALPQPAALAGLWRTSADPAERRRLAHRLAGMARLDEAQGGLARRDYIDFLARNGQVAAATGLARREYARRPDVFSAGQLAWVLALAGEGAEAAGRAAEAARLGSRDRELERYLAEAATHATHAAAPAGARP